MMDDYDQDPSFWDLPSGEDVDGVDAQGASTSSQNREEDDDRNRISWKDEDDSAVPCSQEGFRSLDHSEGSSNSILNGQLGNVRHHRFPQGHNSTARSALVSPGASMITSDVDDSEDDCNDDDRFVASLVTSESNCPEFPSLQDEKSQNDEHDNKPENPNKRLNEDHLCPPSNQHHHCCHQQQPSLESLELQYNRTMKNLILSIERTDETRTFFKRQRVDRHHFAMTMASWESLHLEESRKTLLRTLLQDCGALPPSVVSSHLC